jgi:uncharacterized protein YbjT (DUF2867 family)
MKILVIGGTGQVGAHVVRALAAQGHGVRVMSRNKERAKDLPPGVEIAVADLNDPPSARSAFSGVEGVFMANPVSQTEASEGISGAALAREAKVKRFVYMSVHQVDAAPHLPHFGGKIGVEAAVRATGASWTILRPNNFFQNDFWQKDPVTRYGVYAQPLGGVGLNRVDVRDIADAAARALVGPGFENRAFSLVGPAALTGAACAEILSAKLGKKIAYAGDDLGAWEKAMSAMLPGWMLFDLKMMFAHFQDKGLLATAAELEECQQIVGHPLRTYEAFAAELAQAWK